MTGPRLFPALTALWLAVTPLETAGQDGGVTLEVGAARTFPPSGTDAAQASYGLLGARAERWTAGGTGLWAAVYGARAFDQGASDWASADAGGLAWLGVGGPLDLGLGAAGYGFTVGAPYAHRAWTAEVTPRARLRLGRALLQLNGILGWGRSVVEVRLTDTARLERYRLDRVVVDSSYAPLVRRAERELWHRGIEPELRLLVGPAVASVSAGAFDSPLGTYRKASLSAAGFFGFESPVGWSAVASLWDTPHGSELTGGLMLSVPFGGGWSATASGARSDPSSLILTRATNRGGVTLSKRLFELGRDGRAGAAVASVGTSGSVDFTVRVSGAERVDLLGDFTDWKPVPMRLDAGAWVTTVVVDPGLYHFGFLVDGEWFLPEAGVEGRVSDEWGRENGTLVVPEGT